MGSCTHCGRILCPWKTMRPIVSRDACGRPGKKRAKKAQGLGPGYEALCIRLEVLSFFSPSFLLLTLSLSLPPFFLTVFLSTSGSNSGPRPASSTLRQKRATHPDEKRRSHVDHGHKNITGPNTHELLI